MQQQPKTTVTDAQLGRALREYLATTRGLAIVRDDTDDLPPFRLVRDDRPEGAAPWEVVTVRHAARRRSPARSSDVFSVLAVLIPGRAGKT